MSSRLSGNTKKVSVYGRKAQSRVVNRNTAFTVLNDDESDPFGFFQDRKQDESVDTSLSFQSATSNLSVGSSSREVESLVEVVGRSKPLQVSNSVNIATLSTPKATKTGKRSNVDSPTTITKPRKTKTRAADSPKPPNASTPPPQNVVLGRIPRRAAQAAKSAIEDYDFTDRDMTPRRPVPTKSYFVEKARQLAEWAREDAAEAQAQALQHSAAIASRQHMPVATVKSSRAARKTIKAVLDESESDASTHSVLSESDDSTMADSSQSTYSQPTSVDSIQLKGTRARGKGNAEKHVKRQIAKQSDDEAEPASDLSSEHEDPTTQLVKSVSRMSVAAAGPDLPAGVADLLQTLSQREPEPFDKLIAKLRATESHGLRRIEKLGEASYSEVFTLSPATAEEDTVVMKVIPIAMESRARGSGTSKQPDTSPARDIQQEVQIMQLLSSQPSSAFVSLHSAYVARGKYPAQLLKAWDQWDVKRSANHGQGAENIRPGGFAKSQLYAVLLMSDGGPDLECFELTTWTQAAAVFWQVTAGLAEMEAKFAFEHRDLHWGNILVRATKPCSPQDSAEHDHTFWLSPTACGVRATVIDFTLSRATLPPTKGCAGASKRQGNVVAYAFEDGSVFRGTGDAQFDVYRQMRSVTKGDWTASCPVTNVLWLRYLVNKLITDKARHLHSPSPAGANAKARREWHSWRCLHAIARTLNDASTGDRQIAGRKSVYGAAQKSMASAARKSLAPTAMRPASRRVAYTSAADLLLTMKELALC